jgi:putative ABC transport system permease protein
MNLINSLDPGFNKNNVIVVSMRGDVYERNRTFKEEVEKLKEVEYSSFTSTIPGKRVVFLTVRIPELASTLGETSDGSFNMRVLAVDEDFVKTLQLKIVDGRDFSIENGADKESAFLLNEAAVKEFNLKDPVGKQFEYLFRAQKKGTIIGIVKDFNYASIHSKVEPLMIHIMPWRSFLCVRLNTSNPSKSIDDIERIWKQLSSAPFTYSFLDESYDALYKSERVMTELITYLTVLALAFAGLGLFGIVSFFLTQRTREVGIRKVFGASRFSLLKELSREYMFIVIAGNILAFYPAWWIAQQWLEKFVVKTELSSSTFLVALAASVALAVCSILHVIIRTARTNPATILRNE